MTSANYMVITIINNVKEITKMKRWNSKPLKDLAIKECGSLKAFASAIGRSYDFTRKVFNGESELYTKDVVKIMEVLRIPPHLADHYFFEEA